MDYNVRDSSIYQDNEAFQVYDHSDDSVRIGMVRSQKEQPDGTYHYIVEVFKDGNQIPVSCTVLTRFGGVYNYEEYDVRGWQKIKVGGTMPPATASTYDLRSGDTVLVAFIDGKSREGVILGGLTHAGRHKLLSETDNVYMSSFYGIEEQIKEDGSYTKTFNGVPINLPVVDKALGQPIPPPQYNPIIAGSSYSFEADGSFTVTDGTQIIKIDKSAFNINISSSKSNIALDASGASVNSVDIALTANKDINLEATMNLISNSRNLSLKANKIAIGNDSFELIDGLIKLINNFGNLVINSPTGTCQPFNTAPTWATDIQPLVQKIQQLKTSLKG